MRPIDGGAPEAGPSTGAPVPPLSCRSDPLIDQLLDRCWFPDAEDVDVAVSGGADSVALLALAAASGRRVTAHHVDHGLRPGGDAEAAAVRDLCRRWGAVFRSHRVQVGSGPDLERRCRSARHAALPDGVLLGHTADDQAETVLLRLLRGTGPTGLAAMRRGHHPLLDLRRCETEQLCHHLGVIPFEDPTNVDPRHTRNRVRAEVVPLLDEVAARDVVPLLARLADLAAEQADLLGELAGAIDATDARAVARAPAPVAREALRALWRARTDLLPPDAAGVERMLAVVRGDRPGCDVVAGWSLRRSAGRLELVPPLGDRRGLAGADGATRAADRVGPRELEHPATRSGG